MEKPSARRQRSAANREVVKVVRKRKVLAGSLKHAPQPASVSEGPAPETPFAFSVGDWVTHKLFGPGVVMTVDGNKQEVKFTSVGIKWIIRDFLKAQS